MKAKHIGIVAVMFVVSLVGGTAPLWAIKHTPPPSFTEGVQHDKERAGQWAHVRALHLQREPYCAWCGGSFDLQIHHIRPFALNPELHGSTAPGGENLNVRAECAAHEAEMRKAGTWPQQ